MQYSANYDEITDRLTISVNGKQESCCVGLVLKNLNQTLMNRTLLEEERITNAKNYLLSKINLKQ